MQFILKSIDIFALSMFYIFLYQFKLQTSQIHSSHSGFVVGVGDGGFTGLGVGWGAFEGAGDGAEVPNCALRASIWAW